MDKIKEFIAALREGKSYDWIANHGWELSKDELCRIIKEYDYAIYSKTKMAYKEQEVYDCVADELEEFYEEEC